MTTVAANNKQVDSEDLICPITQEIFHDPVRAGDGHVYERDAITRWILQNGTSPLTRQPLKIDELHPEEKIRHLARRRRQLTVGYDAKDEAVSLPPLKRVPVSYNRTDSNIVRPTVPTPAPQVPVTRTFTEDRTCPRIKCSNKHRVISVMVFIPIVFIIVLIIGTVLGM